MNHRGVLFLPVSLHSKIWWILAASYTLVTSLNNIIREYNNNTEYLGRWQQKNMITVAIRMMARFRSLDC